MAVSLDDACAGMTPEQIVASDHERARICAEMDLLNAMAVNLRERGFDTAVAEAAFETMATVAIELGGELVMTLRVPGLDAITIERPSDILEPWCGGNTPYETARLSASAEKHLPSNQLAADQI